MTLSLKWIIWSVSKQKNIKIFLCTNCIRCVTIWYCFKIWNMCLYHLKISLSCELAKASGVETVSTFTENGIGFNEITLYWMITNINVTRTLYILFICGCQYHPPFRQTRSCLIPLSDLSFECTLLKKSTWISRYQYIKYILHVVTTNILTTNIFTRLWKYTWYESRCFYCTSLWNISLPRIQKVSNATPVTWWDSTEF